MDSRRRNNFPEPREGRHTPPSPFTIAPIQRQHSRRTPARFLSLALLACAAARLAPAAETPIPPSPSRWATDEAAFLSPRIRISLDSRLEAFERESNHQVLVYITRTTGGAPIEDWAARAFKAWRVGRAGIDDGLILFIMADDRKLRIEVGYGLESIVTDAAASRIINDVIVPKIRAGDRDGAVMDGVGAIISAIERPSASPGTASAPSAQAPAGSQRTGGANPQPGAPTSQSPGPRLPRRGGVLFQFLSGLFAMVIILAFLFFAVSLRKWWPYILMGIIASARDEARRGRRHGGWGGGGGFGGGGYRGGGGSWGGGGGGFGGGGFSGGGGRSGGGGASGSW